MTTIGAMVGDVVHSLFVHPVTEEYPFERKPAPEHLRGGLHYDASACRGCQLCVRDCPSAAIEIVTLDKAAKRYAMHYDVGRCTFCAQCVESCRFGTLHLSSQDWELASAQKDRFALDYGFD